MLQVMNIGSAVNRKVKVSESIKKSQVESAESRECRKSEVS